MIRILTFALALALPGAATAQSVLLVDDSGSGAVRTHWETALTTLGLSYTLHIVAGAGSPTAGDMAAGEVVIWFFGDAEDGPSGVDETQMALYLDGGGALLLSAQDYIYSMGGTITPFMTSYLGVASPAGTNGNDMGSGPLFGIPGDFISDPYMTPAYNYGSVGMYNTSYADDLVDDGSATRTFRNAGMLSHIGALRKETADYRTMFFGTPFTPMFADAALGAEILGVCLHWLAYGECEPLDLDGDTFGECDGDCDNGDAAIYPIAEEICNDGIDSNCDTLDGSGIDSDGDGFLDCGAGEDCDDLVAEAFPGNPEVCDFIDNDCDGDVDEDFDVDGDGVSLCDSPPDCDDTNADIYPGAAEACNGIDDDCDGTADEGSDDDGDGVDICGGDCNDNDGDTYPGAPELCDGLDNDCDDLVPADETTDADADGFVECDDCDDADAAIFPGATELCNGIDDDCDLDVDEGLDGDGDGLSLCEDDCDDTDPTIYPGAPELCDLLDNDCDGALAEYEVDADLDGYLECEECDDTDDTVHPGAEEICADGIDSDCLGDLAATEEDDDGDGFAECEGDCDDEDAATHPAAEEICDQGHDNDCNSATDENADTDQDTYTICTGDCDDFDPGSNPDQEEICDGDDNDCNGLIDDGVDYDLDGHTACGGEDCDDLNASVYPGATEVPYDSVDQDCDGEDLDDLDEDGYAGGPYGNDCDDTDATIHPGAEEGCEDGIDSDCDGVGDAQDSDCQEEEPTDEDDSGGGCECSSNGARGPLSGAATALLLSLAVLRRRI